MIRTGKAERTGYEPPQAGARHEGLARRKPARADEVNTHGFGPGEVAGSGAIGVGGWLGEAGKENCVTVSWVL